MQASSRFHPGVVLGLSLALLALVGGAALFGHRGARSVSTDAAPPKVRVIAGPSAVPPPPPSPPETRGGEFGFAAYSDPGPWVPDCTIAVGPSHLVAPVNRYVRFFTKDGAMTFHAPLFGTGGFFSIASDTTVVFDPVALFDPHSQRFFVAAGGRFPDRLYVAVSDDSNPNGAWHQYSFDTSLFGDQTDFPSIGVDGTTLYVSVKMESSTPSQRWKGVVMWLKSSILEGGSAVVTRRQFSNGQFSINYSGVTTFDASAPAQYFASNPSGPHVGASAIRLTALRDPQGDRVVDTFLLPIPPWVFIPVVPELGNPFGLSSEPGHFYKHGVYRGGKLYVANSVGPFAGAGHVDVRWYEIDMNGWPASGQNPSLAQSGVLDLGDSPGGAPISTMYPDISVNSAGDVAICCHRVSAHEYASVIRAFRRAGDPPGMLTDVASWSAGTAPHNGSFNGQWGDYCGMDVDPVEDDAFWGTGQFMEPGAYRTWIGRLSLDPTGVAAAGDAPVSWVSEASPNPFGASTRVTCTVPRSARARVVVHDVAGRVVRSLFDGEWVAGAREVAWDGRDDAARSVSNGVYFLRVEQGAVATTRKVTLRR